MKQFLVITLSLLSLSSFASINSDIFHSSVDCTLFKVVGDDATVIEFSTMQDPGDEEEGYEEGIIKIDGFTISATFLHWQEGIYLNVYQGSKAITSENAHKAALVRFNRFSANYTVSCKERY